MADFRSTKRMRAEKALRQKRKNDLLKGTEDEKLENKKPDPETIKNLIEMWEQLKNKNAKKQKTNP